MDDEELTLFRDTLDRFIQDRVLPSHHEWEAGGMFPRSLWNEMGEQGFLAVDVPDAYGGFGANFRFAMAVLEAFGSANCNGIATSLAVHSDIIAHYVVNHGTDAQKEYYLPRMISGDCVGAIGMTEPGAGSDLQGIRTTARRDGDDYIINGSKTFITNGQHCDLVVLVARTRPDVAGSKGTTLFLVDADAPGFRRGRNLDKIGLHSSDTSELFFDDMRVPASAVLGEVDNGFGILMGELARERLALAVGALASTEGVLEETVAYVKERQAFGQPIAAFQNTRYTLADLATDVRVHRAFIDQCCQQFMDGTLDVATVSMAKLATTEMQKRVIDSCLQLHGGNGYMREYTVARAYVDARVQRIYGGTSEIMKELISRSVLK